MRCLPISPGKLIHRTICVDFPSLMFSLGMGGIINTFATSCCGTTKVCVVVTSQDSLSLSPNRTTCHCHLTEQPVIVTSGQPVIVTSQDSLSLSPHKTACHCHLTGQPLIVTSQDSLSLSPHRTACHCHITGQPVIVTSQDSLSLSRHRTACSTNGVGKRLTFCFQKKARILAAEYTLFLGYLETY